MKDGTAQELSGSSWFLGIHNFSLQVPHIACRKLELILFYFGVRKCSTHFVSFVFFCTLVPLSVFTPEVRGQHLQ